MPAEGSFWKLLKDLGAEHDRQLSSMVSLVRELRMELDKCVKPEASEITNVPWESNDLRKPLGHNANNTSMLAWKNGVNGGHKPGTCQKALPSLKLPLPGLMDSHQVSSASLSFPLSGANEVPLSEEPQAHSPQTGWNAADSKQPQSVADEAAAGCTMVKTLEPQSQHQQSQYMEQPELQQQQQQQQDSQQQAELLDCPHQNASPEWDVAGLESDEIEEIDEATLSPIQRRFRCVDHPAFEKATGCLIVANTIVMMVEAQYVGLKAGYLTQFHGIDGPVEETWPGADQIFVSIDKFFTCLFAVELILRIIRHQFHFFIQPLNWIDIVSVVASVLHEVFENVWKASFIRLLRVARLVRGIRFLKGNKLQHSLKILMKSMQASGVTLFWALGLLMVIQCIIAMVVGQVALDYIIDVSNPIEDRHQVFRYYGTFTRSFITMFEVHMANWATPCRILINNVGELWGNIFVFYRCIAGFALMSVIGAVFVQQAMSVQQQDQDLTILRKQKEAESYSRKLKQLFSDLDNDGDGQLSKQEFEAITEDPDLKAKMESLDINPDDLQGLFTLLDTGDGFVSADEFLTGATRVRGSARNIDVAQLLVMVNRLEQTIHRMDKLLGGDVVVRLEKLEELLARPKQKRSSWALDILQSPGMFSSRRA